MTGVANMRKGTLASGWDDNLTIPDEPSEKLRPGGADLSGFDHYQKVLNTRLYPAIELQGPISWELTKEEGAFSTKRRASRNFYS